MTTDSARAYPGDLDTCATEAIAISDAAQPIFAGKHPASQGAALAELLVRWIAGHHPAELRASLLAEHFQSVRDMLSELEEEQ